MIIWTFYASQGLTITKAIIELTGSSGSSSLVQNRPRGWRRFEDNAINFYEKDRRIWSAH